MHHHVRQYFTLPRAGSPHGGAARLPACTFRCGQTPHHGHSPEHTLRLFAFAALILICAGTPAVAQSISAGAVSGVVTDSTGRPLGDVRVALTDRRSGFTWDLRTPRSGRFAFQFS